MKNRIACTSFLLSISLLTACSIQAVRTVQPKEALLVQQFPNAQTVELTKLVYAVPDGKVVGKVAGGWGCIPAGTITWRSGSPSTSEGTLYSKVASALASSGLKVKAASTELFDVKQSPIDFQLGGRILEVDTNSCSSTLGLKGSALVVIEWQVFSKSANKVIFQTKSEGSYFVDSFKSGYGLNTLFTDAVEQASKNLLANKEFWQTLETK